MVIDKNIISFRKATQSDIENIIEYRFTFLKETQGNPTPEMESVLRQSLSQYLTKSIGNDSFVSWIAIYESKPVGFSGMVIREQPGNFEIPNGKTGYILNMFTLKEFRKKGIASTLFQKLMAEAKQRNLERIELYATKDGEPIYRQFGFAEPHDKALEWIVK